MVTTNQIELMLYYVASQLADKWFAPAKGRLTTGDAQPQDLSLSEWETLYAIWLAQGSVTRVAGKLATLKITAKDLARHTYEHLRLTSDRQMTQIGINDPRYPVSLRALTNPPLFINCLGDLSRLDAPSIAIVGARRASARARLAAFELGRYLSQAGVCVVSGGAYGCDISAHQGVLSCDGTAHAIVVMAGGLSSLYPRGLLPVFQKLLEKGALFISEKLVFQKPLPYHFPIRNRIIAGLAEELVLIQAARKSGAMTTALAALNHGRPVYVLRPEDHDTRFEGNVLLEQDGAPVFGSALEYLYLSSYHAD